MTKNKPVEEPNWKEIVERIWVVITDWEHDLGRGANSRCCNRIYEIMSQVEEQWQSWDKQELISDRE